MNYTLNVTCTCMTVHKTDIKYSIYVLFPVLWQFLLLHLMFMIGLKKCYWVLFGHQLPVWMSWTSTLRLSPFQEATGSTELWFYCAWSSRPESYCATVWVLKISSWPKYISNDRSVIMWKLGFDPDFDRLTRYLWLQVRPVRLNHWCL